MDTHGATAALWPDYEASCDPMSHDEVVPEHFHDFGQLAYAVSGAVVTATRFGTWLAPANRITWVPPQVVHSRRSYGDADVRVLPVSPSLCGRLPAQPVVSAVSPLMREAFLALDDARADHESSSAERVALLLEVIAGELHGNREDSLRLPEPRDDRLRAVTDLMREDPANPATLAELGRLTGASERTLSRLFGDELGMSFRRWRTMLRIQHALIELGAGTSVTTTSIRLGWANPTSFIGAFTSLLGETPGRYQRAVASTDTRRSA